MHDSPQVHLPEDAKLRLGKGKIHQVAYSSDGTIVAVATQIGLWLYDVKNSNKSLFLLPHKCSIESIAFSTFTETFTEQFYEPLFYKGL